MSWTNEELGIPPRELTLAEKVVAEQAGDEALWFNAETITENMLQEALRRLHAAVEGDEAIVAALPSRYMA